MSLTPVFTPDWTLLDSTVSPVMALFSPMQHRHHRGSDWYTCTVQATHLNAAGQLHGGFFCTLLDLTMGHAAWHAIQARGSIRTMATVALNATLTSPAHENDILTVQVKVLRITQTLVFVTALMRCKQRPLAQGTATIHYRLAT
ncbi:MAG TPA: PaaI family thioesterase [Limnobacter sp.]|uniref:PaaI family thioesterase n=1 Tax=Limnobacter sp. TaxID=2003368 RepID=UPI002ED86FDD